LGAVLGIAILYVRRNVPESPRWLITHGHADRAETEIRGIEKAVAAEHGPLPKPAYALTMRLRDHVSWSEIAHLMAFQYRRRAVLGLSLMAAQAFFYNAIFFTYGLVLMRFYGVPAERVGVYLLPFALGNVLGPFVIGHLFDTIGRKKMIAGTYAVSGVLLAATGWLFEAGMLTAQTQTLAWTVIFFVASAAASSAYLTVSEIFPLEIRAMAIAIFYAVGTLAGGVGAPVLFGWIIGSGSRGGLAIAYGVGAVLMIAAAGIEMWLGVAAERRSLEHIAAPLSSREI
jgi:MFS family permease